jgi:hypothetical protein
LGFAAVPAQGSLLGLALLDYPDITSGFTDVTYGAASDQFAASGFALSFDDDGTGSAENILNGVFSIDAAIDESGEPGPGTLVITGDVLGYGPDLLTASLTDFGFMDGGGDIFEFLFEVTGGDLAIPSLYGDPGSVVGLILDATGSDFGGTFDMDFDNTGGMPGWGMGVSDTAPIPEPSSLLLMLLAGALFRRRRA